ncbi:MAG: leucine-rich repeat protein [Clostridia bacterium]|nr:leucine-rich repeat protein [Clostridia bacterium]
MKLKLNKYFLFFCLITFSVLMMFIGCENANDTELDSLNTDESTFSSSSVELDITESSSIIENLDTPKPDEEMGNKEEVEEGASSSADNESASTEEPESSGSSSSSDCGEDDYEVGDSVVEHVFTTERVEPDCITKGYIKSYCVNCGEQESFEEISALGHDEETIAGYSSTCLEHGATESVRCKRCEKTLIESKSLPLADHNYKNDWSCAWCDLAALEFTLYNDSYAICTGPIDDGNARRVVIPDQVELVDSQGVPRLYDVKEIKEGAFDHHYEMYSLEIGKNVENIGNTAFGFCYNLLEIYDKSKMRVGELSMDKNGCLTMDIGWKKDFYYEEFDSNIEIIDGCVIYTDGEEKVLIGCTNDPTDLKGSSLVIPEGVTKINSYVFTNSNYIASVTIAKSVKEIANYAFYSTCDRSIHYENGHDAAACDSPIDEVIMLNPIGWKIDTTGQDKENLYIPVPENLSSSYVAWEYLVVHYKYYWRRAE